MADVDPHEPHEPEEEPATYWERRYAHADGVWSGRVNATMAEICGDLRPGRALDLGCGEGADVIWLAAHGWDATGVDISPTAVARAQSAARQAGVAARFVAADLTEWSIEGAVDLVTASFLHSPVAFDRTRALRRAGERIAPGGRLLILTHAAPPPWASPEHVRDHVFLSPQDEAAELDLDPDRWVVERAEVRSRPVTAPDGGTASLDDGVVLLRRAS